MTKNIIIIQNLKADLMGTSFVDHPASWVNALDNLVSPKRSILHIIINSSQTNGLIMDIIEQSLIISTMFHNR